jgi:hypothetical protein
VSAGSLPVSFEEGHVLVPGTNLEALDGETGARVWNAALPAPGVDARRGRGRLRAGRHRRQHAALL